MTGLTAVRFRRGIREPVMMMAGCCESAGCGALGLDAGVCFAGVFEVLPDTSSPLCRGAVADACAAIARAKAPTLALRSRNTAPNRCPLAIMGRAPDALARASREHTPVWGACRLAKSGKRELPLAAEVSPASAAAHKRVPAAAAGRNRALGRSANKQVVRCAVQAAGSVGRAASVLLRPS